MPLEPSQRVGVRSPRVDVCIIVGVFGAIFFVFFLVANAGGTRPSASFAADDSIAFGGGAWAGPSDPMIERLAACTPARAILLTVAITGTRTRHRGQRFEVRRCKIDIEPVGYAPYEISANVYIPSTLVRDVLPGSTMEVRVDAANLNQVLVIGPDVGFAQGSVRTAS
jgi:hypothetical protein